MPRFILVAVKESNLLSSILPAEKSKFYVYIFLKPVQHWL
jgi:hypothetical protein